MVMMNALKKLFGSWSTPLLLGGVALATSVAFVNCERARQFEAALEAEKQIISLERTFRVAFDHAEAIATAERAIISMRRAVDDAIWLAEAMAADEEITRAAIEAESIDDEFRRTGRVTESARRVYFEMLKEGGP